MGEQLTIGGEAFEHANLGGADRCCIRSQGARLQPAQPHELITAGIGGHKGNPATIAERLHQKDAGELRGQGNPGTGAVLHLELLAVLPLHHSQERGTGIPEPGRRRQRQTAAIRAGQPQTDHALRWHGLLDQQTPGVIAAEPAMRQRRGQAAAGGDRCLPHRPAEANIQRCGARPQGLDGQLPQPGRPLQQHLLLHQHERRQCTERQQQRAWQGEASGTGHGSSGRSGRGMLVTTVGLTALRSTPPCSSTTMVPFSASQVSGVGV